MVKESRINTMKKFTLVIAVMFSVVIFGISQDSVVVPYGSIWKYLDNGSNQGSSWRFNNFNDASWDAGPAELGYGDGDESTVVSYGPSSSNKHITTYFRHSFNIDDVSQYKNFLLKLKRDDGALVYINGVEVMRSNFGTNTYAYDDESYTAISTSSENLRYHKLIEPTRFQDGVNVIAVEVHQADPGSSDLSFDFELIGLDAIPSVYRDPYLQTATPTSITVKWKTDIPTDSRVSYGTTEGVLNSTEDVAALTINHEVVINGLTPNTKYYYSVGTSTTELAGNSTDFYFTTHPPSGQSVPTRIWAIGDAGTGTYHQADVRDSYINFVGNDKSDVWLMLGDNAYIQGREADYHTGVFKNMYEPILRNTTLWPCPGNHDFYGEASPISETGTYYDIFALPINGEAGGVASGTESYYSYDYGNVHFISLESYGLNRDSTGTMATWLKSDLENVTADWIVAYWHYPPYSKTSHDSDDPGDHSGRCIDMRENFNPILESYGVDLVLSGHSHAYERTYFLNGHYGFSNTLDPSMILNDESGKADESGAYVKPKDQAPNSGTVYAVCGSSGKLTSTNEFHPAMYFTTINHYGSMVIDIEGDTLEAKFINDNGVIIDYFHIVKEGYQSIENTKQNDGINLYPNPSNGIVNIELESVGAKGKKLLEIYSSRGKLVWSEEIILDDVTTVYSLNASDLAKGFYTLKITQDTEILGAELLIVE